MDAIKFIINEHNQFKRKFAAISKAGKTDAIKVRMFKTLCNQLVRHETMEEKVWYPNFKNDPKVKAVVKLVIKEEKDASKKIKNFKKLKFKIDFNKQFPPFKKAVLAHASDEQKKLFPKVRKILDKAELQEIGKDLRKFKIRYDKTKKNV